jgi:hypothetical protein
MTKRWGPLGWATLHSIAALYPDAPSDYEKQLILRWITAFRDTILCPSCQSHFATMFESYIRSHPNWWNSRKDLSEFVFRAHNTVNFRTFRRLYSFTESIAELERVFPSAKCSEVRRLYLVYIRQDWMRNMTMDGISSFSKIKELNMIEAEYWGRRPAFAWSDLLQFEDIINVSSLHEHAGSSTLSTPGIPRITAPSRGFSLKFGSGKIGGLRSLR